MMIDHSDMINKILLIYFFIVVVVFVVIFILSNFVYKKFIPYMKEKHMGQVIRKEGMETHYKKEGTPTMGGIVFGLIFISFGAIYTLVKIITKAYYEVEFVPMLCLFTFLLMCIGYKDDIRKITKNNSDGLSPKTKLIFQILSSLFFVIVIMILKNTMGYGGTYIKIPFVNYFIRDIKVDFSNILMVVAVVLINVFILVGTQNGVNFTDGLDSLLANVTIVITIFYIIESVIRIKICLTLLNVVMLSLLFSFRKYNKYPAKIFMGDTGSLLLGAYVGGVAYILEIQYFLPIYGFVYMMEVISVILQVSYFKITKGKRIFKMAPIHHHFEKCGWSEKKVVKVFTIVTIVMCTISFFMILHPGLI